MRIKVNEHIFEAEEIIQITPIEKDFIIGFYIYFRNGNKIHFSTADKEAKSDNNLFAVTPQRMAELAKMREFICAHIGYKEYQV